jgi:hypothetical protein
MSKIVDDMLLQATNYDELLNRLQVVFDICFKEGITLSLAKLEIGNRVPFAGFVVSAASMTPDPAKVEAITAFSLTNQHQGLEVIPGLANQLTSFLPDFAHSTVKMRELLKSTSAWCG